MKRSERVEINGFVLVDKPAGMTSNHVLQKVKRLFNAKKAGHTGTLDPFATGMLPVCFGKATKLAQYLIDDDKAYRAMVKLGEATATGDIEGDIIEKQDVLPLTQSIIDEVFENFTGQIRQVPPMYSALKHQGKRLYELAREGIEVDRPARSVNIHALKCIQFDTNHIEFEVVCSKGTYVRTLAEDIAKALNTCGHLISLRRLYTTGFKTYEMHGIEKIDASTLMPLSEPIQTWPKMELTEEQVKKMRFGQDFGLPSVQCKHALYCQGICVGILIINADKKQTIKQF